MTTADPKSSYNSDHERVFVSEAYELEMNRIDMLLTNPMLDRSMHCANKLNFPVERQNRPYSPRNG